MRGDCARYGELRMTRPERLKRLREAIAEIELLPASPERNRLLSEFRSRAVDIDTGVAPRPMLPMAEPDAERAPRRPASPARERAVEVPSAAAPREDPFLVAEWLSLDEPESPPGRTRDGRAVPPWTFGLRG